jgi:pimeloyl-ACP methyl ester carboxylesterase
MKSVLFRLITAILFIICISSCQAGSTADGGNDVAPDGAVNSQDSLDSAGDLGEDLGFKDLPGPEDALGDVEEDVLDAASDVSPAPDADAVAPQDTLPPDTMPEPAGTYAVFFKTPVGFFDRPFPSNTRLTEDGLEISDWPNPYKAKLIDQYKAVLAHGGRGFSCNPVMYVRFSAALDLGSLPDVEASRLESSPVQLIDVTEGPEAGTRYPLEFLFWDKKAPKANWYTEQNVLAIRLPSGVVLPPNHTFTLLVSDSLKDAQGEPVGRSWFLRRLLEDGPVDAQDQVVLDSLKPALDALDADAIAGAVAISVFTTGDPTADMRRVAQTIREEARPLAGEAPTLSKAYTNYTLYTGSYRAPNFQAGDIPYATGGNFVFDQDGKPVVQRLEEIPYALAIPKGTAPANGWPLVLVSHGTGGSRLSFTKDGSATALAAAGLAAMAIDQPLHGGRVEAPVANLELYSFNFTNPDSGRWLFRQGAADAVSQSAFVTDLLADELTTLGVKVDPTRLGFFGHSQGGLTGALFQGVDFTMKAVVLSGAGGLLSDTLMLRKELDAGTEFDIQKMMALLLGIQNPADLSVFHTVVSLMQAVVDPTDPVNYSPLFFRRPGAQQASCVLQVQGMQDPYTPLLTAESLAAAGAWPVLTPPGTSNPVFTLLGIPEGQPPLEGNMDAAATPPASAALAVYPNDGHFPAFDNQDCIDLWTAVLKKSLTEDRCLIAP